MKVSQTQLRSDIVSFIRLYVSAFLD